MKEIYQTATHGMSEEQEGTEKNFCCSVVVFVVVVVRFALFLRGLYTLLVHKTNCTTQNIILISYQQSELVLSPPSSLAIAIPPVTNHTSV